MHASLPRSPVPGRVQKNLLLLLPRETEDQQCGAERLLLRQNGMSGVQSKPLARLIGLCGAWKQKPLSWCSATSPLGLCSTFTFSGCASVIKLAVCGMISWGRWSAASAIAKAAITLEVVQDHSLCQSAALLPMRLAHSTCKIRISHRHPTSLCPAHRQPAPPDLPATRRHTHTHELNTALPVQRVTPRRHPAASMTPAATAVHTPRSVQIGR